MSKWRLGGFAAAVLGVAAMGLVPGARPQPAGAAEPVTVRVNAFPNAKALPLQAGIANGIFLKHGIKLELQLTPNSKAQREGLAAGTFEIAQAALDNAVAMIEVGKKDVVIVSGGDSGMNEFFVQADVKSFTDLRGRTIVVDAPDTAYALQVKKILLKYGLKDGADYTIKPVGAGTYRYKALIEDKANAGGILNLPFTVQAEEKGLKSLGRTIDLLGPYQAAGGFAMRAWARDNGPVLERYLAGYIESLRWVRDPSHKAQSVAILTDKLKLSPHEAERTYELLLDPHFGFTPDAKFDAEGFRNMLALRAEVQRKAGTEAVAPERYVDLSYYDRALKSLTP
ncbi:MAG TPA: ABC transporter substrate-binding protein [Xanthobacteraceae bacterium]|nr:ABC transporter substrate-binding protein [Xanthobacteraceae bacterium]